LHVHFAHVLRLARVSVEKLNAADFAHAAPSADDYQVQPDYLPVCPGRIPLVTLQEVVLYILLIKG